MADESVEVSEYHVNVNGVDTTMQLNKEDAERLGGKAVTDDADADADADSADEPKRKQRTPANKADTPYTK